MTNWSGICLVLFASKLKKHDNEFNPQTNQSEFDNHLNKNQGHDTKAILLTRVNQFLKRK